MLARRLTAVLIATSALVGAVGAVAGDTRPADTASQPGAPLPDLTESELALVSQGRQAFESQKTIPQGLGPLFNEISCSRCHNKGGVGGAGIQALTFVGRSEGTSYDALLAHGGPLIAQASVRQLRADSQRLLPGCKLSAEGEPVPGTANVITRRRTTPLFGLGLVEATPDATFEALAAKQPPAVRGRVARPPSVVPGQQRVGKFGWKAQVPTLEEFAALAFRNELGITSPMFPDEQLPEGDAAKLAACDLVPGLEDDGSAAQHAADFMRLLAPVAPLPQSKAARAGDRLFGKLGCDSCHVRALQTGPHQVAALSRREYQPYSDFLLHDMGARADGIGSDGDAAPREMRTAPLWGLHLQQQRFMHDGRARSLEDAIRQHEGQGSQARDAFTALSDAQRAELIAFLHTL
ncbi:MAG: di-heme oxidoredictase family protein [Polyangiaceae bacterium]